MAKTTKLEDLVAANEAVMDGLSAYAPEPAGLVEDEVIHAGSAELPVPVVVSSITSAGYVYIYDTKTGDRSLTNKNMLAIQLKKLRADGSRVFTTIKPDITVVNGNIKCLLHKDSPTHLQYAAMGFPECTKDNLISEFHRDRHMASKHRSEWAAIKADRDKAARAEDRAFQRAILTGRLPAAAVSN